MNLGPENEARAYRLNVKEIEGACVSLCAMLNRHQIFNSSARNTMESEDFNFYYNKVNSSQNEDDDNIS